MICTRCGGSNVRLSSHAKWRDPFRLPWGQRALRCRTCSAQFYARPDPGLAAAKHTKHSRKTEGTRGANRLRRSIVEAIIFVALLLLFLSFLKFLTREHSTSPDASQNLIVPLPTS